MLLSRQQTVLRKLRTEVYRRRLPSDWCRAGEETKTGVIAGYEQPLTQRLSFIVDWSSGNNRFGYISPLESQHSAQRQPFGRLCHCQPGTRQKLAVLLLWPAVLVDERCGSAGIPARKPAKHAQKNQECNSRFTLRRPGMAALNAYRFTSCCNSYGSLKSSGR